MLSVLSAILEYRKDGRNSSDRPTIRPQSLCCMYSLHSRHFKAKPKHVHLYSFQPYQLQLIIKHAFGRAQMLN